MLRKRREYPELKRTMREEFQAFVANVLLVEDKASGTRLIQQLVEPTTYTPSPLRARLLNAV